MAEDYIPPEILQAILKKIGKSIQRFVEAIDDRGNTPQAQLQEEEVVRSEVCRLLKLIMRFNRRRLPRDLRRYWTAFGCSES